MDKFMSGLADMMSGPTPEEDLGADVAGGQQGLAESRDMDSFRRDLIKQTRYVYFPHIPPFMMMM